MYKITQTQLLEWVKDGNAQTLAIYFRENLAANLQGLQQFFKMIDNQKRNVVHWAAYFGQLELLENWLQSYSQYIDLNRTDMHHYTPLELASIKGFMKEQDSLIQFSLIKLLIENKAIVRLDNPYQRATPLHWAYYYGNTELIKFLLSNYPDLQYQLDQFGMYPVDYLFLENRPQEYQRNYKGIFIATVVEYAQTIYNHQFKNLRNLNTQMTMTFRSQSLKSQGNDSRDRLQLKEPANEIDSDFEERTQNYQHAGLTTMTLMSKVRQTCIDENIFSLHSTMSQKRDSLTSRLSQQFKQIKERMTKLPNKNIPNEIPFDDSQLELNEPEAEKIPTVRIMQPTNTIFIDPHKNYIDQSNKILNSTVVTIQIYSLQYFDNTNFISKILVTHSKLRNNQS